MQIPIPTETEKNVTGVDLIVSKSDSRGNIIYTNPIFISISGYTQEELLKKPHSILRHPDMPKVIFKYLWENLHAGNDVIAYVKNLCKDGSYYWGLSTVATLNNPDGSFDNFTSIREPITQTAKKSISEFYANLLYIQNNEDMESSEEYFDNYLQQKNIHNIDEYNQFMQNLNS